MDLILDDIVLLIGVKIIYGYLGEWSMLRYLQGWSTITSVTYLQSVWPKKLCKILQNSYINICIYELYVYIEKMWQQNDKSLNLDGEYVFVVLVFQLLYISNFS